MKANSVLVEAMVRIVGMNKGQELCAPEKFQIELPVTEGGQDNISLFLSSGEMISVDPRIIQVCCDTEVRFRFVETFRRRLKDDPILKSRIGGIKWSVEVDSLSFKIVTLERAQA